MTNGTTTTLLGGTSSGSTGSYKESSFWQNPTFRIRHMLLKLDNDIVSMWFGQTWELVGFQSSYHPNTVEIQGVPGQIYSRTPQLRLLHDFKFGDAATLEIAVAALRPPQEDSSIPDLQGGIKLSIDGYKGLQTVGATGTSMQPASIAISGAYRWYSLATTAGVVTKADGNEQQITGNVIAADIMLPVISPAFELPVALTFIGETSFGTGDADLFTSLSGGVGVGTPPNYPASGAANYTGAYPQSYQAGIDPGLAGWNSKDVLETVDWRSVAGRRSQPLSAARLQDLAVGELQQHLLRQLGRLCRRRYRGSGVVVGRQPLRRRHAGGAPGTRVRALPRELQQRHGAQCSRRQRRTRPAVGLLHLLSSPRKP